MDETSKWMQLSNLKTGDKVTLTNGKTAEFVRLKQKKFIGIMDNVSYDIPVSMFVGVESVAIVKDKSDEYKSLQVGEPFYIDKNGSAMLFTFVQFTNGHIIGINPITKGKTRIQASMYVGKVSNIAKEG